MLELLANAPMRILALVIATTIGLVVFQAVTAQPFSGWGVATMAGVVVLSAMVAVRKVSRFY